MYFFQDILKKVAPLSGCQSHTKSPDSASSNPSSGSIMSRLQMRSPLLTPPLPSGGVHPDGGAGCTLRTGAAMRESSRLQKASLQAWLTYADRCRLAWPPLRALTPQFAPLSADSVTLFNIYLLIPSKNCQFRLPYARGSSQHSWISTKQDWISFKL